MRKESYASLFICFCAGSGLIQDSAGRGKGGLPRVNDAVLAENIRLVDAEGNTLGVFPREVALQRATGEGLDIVEVRCEGDVSTCKLVSYSRYRYEAKRKHKKQKVSVLKEMRLRPNIGDADYNVKLRKVISLLEDGHKVKISLKFVGREILHSEVGLRLLERVIQDTVDVAKVESATKREGNRMFLVLAPK